jgi:hypothetical protein
MRGLSGTMRRPLVRSYWRVAVAAVLPVDRRWPLPLVLKGPRPCSICGHAAVSDDVLTILAPERPALN